MRQALVVFGSQFQARWRQAKQWCVVLVCAPFGSVQHQMRPNHSPMYRLFFACSREQPLATNRQIGGYSHRWQCAEWFDPLTVTHSINSRDNGLLDLAQMT